MLRWKKRSLAGLLGTLLVGAAALVGMSCTPTGDPKEDKAGPESGASAAEAAHEPAAVRTIRPRYDPSFTLSTRAPAQVIPYDWADLEAEVGGVVEYIRKAEGSPITAGEVLVRIAVPDLEQELREKEGVIRQRQAELGLAQANERIAGTAITVATKNLLVAQAAVDAAQATEDYRGRVFRRFRGLVEDRAATQQIVDENRLNYEAAVADTRRARADLEKARADLERAQAKFDAAKADVKLKAEMIDVARQDRDRAQALVNYAKITAPFDGVVTRRYVNRGSFVQNATAGHAGPLLRVERRDIVTVQMRVPDTFAPYVTSGTEAVIEMSELPGQQIHGRVSRFSPTLESAAKDKTLLVDVDLFNGTDAEYQQFLAREKAKKTPFDDLKEGPLPLAPRVTGKAGGDFQRLYPGMYGEMELIFRHLPNVYLVPSDAIVRMGGTPYLYLVRNGKAAVVPVEVQMDDQHLARVAIVGKAAGGVARRGLTGDDVVIYSNQSELTDGEPVKSIPEDWAP